MLSYRERDRRREKKEEDEGKLSNSAETDEILTCPLPPPAKQHLSKVLLMSTHKICFYGEKNRKNRIISANSSLTSPLLNNLLNYQSYDTCISPMIDHMSYNRHWSWNIPSCSHIYMWHTDSWPWTVRNRWPWSIRNWWPWTVWNWWPGTIWFICLWSLFWNSWSARRCRAYWTLWACTGWTASNCTGWTATEIFTNQFVCYCVILYISRELVK